LQYARFKKRAGAKTSLYIEWLGCGRCLVAVVLENQYQRADGSVSTFQPLLCSLQGMTVLVCC
jgi:hypothetical protein